VLGIISHLADYTSPHTLTSTPPQSSSPSSINHKQVVAIKDKPLPPPDSPLMLLQEPRASTPPSPSSKHARQFHAQLAFAVQPPAALQRNSGASNSTFNFTVGVRLLTGGSSHVDITLQGSAAAAAAAAAAADAQQQKQEVVITALRVAVDKTRTGGYTPGVVEGGPVPLPVVARTSKQPAAAWELPEKLLTLDVFVDHSILEVYAMQGLGRVTSRIYPADELGGWGLAAFGVVTGVAAGGGSVLLKSADIWSLNNSWADQPPLC